MFQDREQMLLLTAQVKMAPNVERMTTVLDALMAFYLNKSKNQAHSKYGPMDAACAFAAVRNAIEAADLLTQFGETLDDIMDTLRAISDEPDTEGVD